VMRQKGLARLEDDASYLHPRFDLLHLTRVAGKSRHRPMLDFLPLIGAAEFLLREFQALTFGHTVPAVALTSSVAQTAWVHLRCRGVPSSRSSAIGQIARIGLCSVIFAALPPGSRLVVLLLERAARSVPVPH